MSILEPGLADQQLTAIAVSVGALIREHYGRDAIKVKAWAVDDMILVVIRGYVFTALEKAMIDGGEPQGVIALRADFDSIMADRYKHVVKEATGRTVLALLSQSHVDPDITVHTMCLDKRLRRLAAVARAPLPPRH